ncbi:MAG: type II CRISPR RNA-guided endonuclease Cas9, partial [Helicobacter sp.]|nr:type II CRISPR RNA-guided endonuclease Cas9 [Helicobacter sp.]
MKIFSFDIGIASIGWAYIEDDVLKDCGVRIFTKAENPKNGDSLAAPRREARSARRRLARRKGRLNALKKLICKEFGLKLGDYLAPDGKLPKAYETNKETKSPYELRALALKQKLDSKDLARVILHIAKHRGYGNKHAKDADDDESGKVKKAIKENEKILLEKGYQSAGQYLYNEFFEKPRDFDVEQKSSNNTRGTQEFRNVRNKAESYARCLNQSELQKELGFIFAKQRELGFNFSDKKYKIIDENGKLKELDFESA